MRPHPDPPEDEAAFYSDPNPAQADYVHTETPGGIPITFAIEAEQMLPSGVKPG